ncbi:hypothetical protein [Paraburkholderia sp. SIMBA_054]|uniref:hypothetical protein n=1 Tax=Paraburkholderia sp. SIMBA_054 TaxID=3085795 RepID=UPI00397870FA
MNGNAASSTTHRNDKAIATGCASGSREIAEHAAAFLVWSEAINPAFALGDGMAAHGAQLMEALRKSLNAAKAEGTVARAARAALDWRDRINPAFAVGDGNAAHGKILLGSLRKALEAHPSGI